MAKNKPKKAASKKAASKKENVSEETTKVAALPTKHIEGFGELIDKKKMEGEHRKC